MPMGCLIDDDLEYELGDKNDLIDNPAHPYTKGLLDSIPRMHQDRLPVSLEGLQPQPGQRIFDNQCVFVERCRYARPVCQQHKPDSSKVLARQGKCHLANEALDGKSVEGSGQINKSREFSRVVLRVTARSESHDRP